MKLNPILTRETRARWRGRAFALLFCGVAILAVAMIIAYNDATTQWLGDGDRAARIGAKLFGDMTYYQMCGWMLLAPSLTATAIAGEREQGLLEALQLSRLSPGQIVRGKLYSTLAFIGLLLLATQPVMAICFLLGGVSPMEFANAFAQILLTALAGASLGLCVSAWSRRSSNAAGTTLGCILMWGFGTMIVFALSMWPKVRGVPFVSQTLVGLSMLNPVFARIVQQWPYSTPLPALAAFGIEPEWICRFLLCGASILLLLASVPAVRRPFADQPWMETFAATPEAGFVTAESKTSKAARGTVHLPIADMLRFRNPILQRDLRAKLLFRRPGPWAMFFQFWLLAGLIYMYLWALWKAYTTQSGAYNLWPMINGASLFALILLPAILSATAITREKESDTWQSVQLSLLSPVEIIFAKQMASMAVVPLLLLPLLPFVPVCLRASEYDDHVTIWQMLLTLLLHLATAWFASAWGLAISNHCRKTAVATSWTIGSLFVLLVIAPGIIVSLIDDMTGDASTSRTLDFVASAHPFGAFSQLFDHRNDWWHWATLRGIVFLFALGSALLTLLRLDLEKKAGREK